ncbi:MAG TPA: hypothetical protein VFM44_01900 [Gemmatimonadota bacterium]|nr:hypothetical protein [Gemmatimonadota bacterium]
MELSEALREENRRLRRLRLVVDLTLARLYQDPDLSLLEALQLTERCRDTALAMFPGKETAFDLIYRPRFERVLHARWPHDMPDELGESFVLGEPEKRAR